MQRQKFNILGGLNIQSTWCLECDSYMHTSSIAAPRYSDRKTRSPKLKQVCFGLAYSQLSILHEEGVDYS